MVDIFVDRFDVAEITRAMSICALSFVRRRANGERWNIRYARCAGGIDIAYKVVGEGPIDFVYVPGFVSHLDLLDDVPFFCNPVNDMARFARVVMFDKRGTGLSDRSLGFGSLPTGWMTSGR